MADRSSTEALLGERGIAFERVESPAGTLLCSGRLGARVLLASSPDAGITAGWMGLPALRGEVDTKAFNNCGGIDRLWLAPEGSRFSVFFAPGTDFQTGSWTVPPELNAADFPVVARTEDSIAYETEMRLANRIGTRFHLGVRREFRVLAPLPQAAGLSQVRFVSNTVLTNLGDDWRLETGLVSAWILAQVEARCHALVPYRRGEAPPKFFYGDTAPERYRDSGGWAALRCDARSRAKIGLPCFSSLGAMGALSFDGRELTVIRFGGDGVDGLVPSSAWSLDDTYGGDAIAVYNANSEVPAEGAYFELESMAAARELRRGESQTHWSETSTFAGDPAAIASLARTILGVEPDQLP